LADVLVDVFAVEGSPIVHEVDNDDFSFFLRGGFGGEMILEGGIAVRTAVGELVRMASVIPRGKRYEGNLTNDGDDAEVDRAVLAAAAAAAVGVDAGLAAEGVDAVDEGFVFDCAERLLASMSALANTDPKKWLIKLMP